MNSNLLEAAKNRTLIPFIGAGFSRNLELPTWDDIMLLIADRLGWSPEVMITQGDYYQIAEYYFLEKRGSIAGLRSELDHKFNSTSIDISTSRSHSLLVDLDAPIIYTTNWDTLIEKAFTFRKKPYYTVRSLNDIIDIPKQITQIVKFHGDFTGNDEDIVFTETSYFNRLDFESALDIKFRSDVLGKSLIFIGYSFRDINIRFLWHKLIRLINQITAMYKYDYPKSYILSLTPSPLQERLFRSKNIEVINVAELDPKDGLENFLAELVKAVK